MFVKWEVRNKKKNPKKTPQTNKQKKPNREIQFVSDFLNNVKESSLIFF